MHLTRREQQVLQRMNLNEELIFVWREYTVKKSDRAVFEKDGIIGNPIGQKVVRSLLEKGLIEETCRGSFSQELKITAGGKEIVQIASTYREA